MAKKAKPQSGKRKKKPVCMACDYREGAEQYLREEQERGNIGEPYSGQMVSVSGGQAVVVSSFAANKLVGLTAIPLTDVHATTQLMNNTALGLYSELSRIAAENVANGDEDDEEEEHEDDDEEADDD